MWPWTPEATHCWSGCTPKVKSRLIDAAWRPAGGTFGAPITLSTSDEGLSAPVVAMDSAGEATIAWVIVTLGGQRVEAVTRTPDGVFSEPEALSYDYIIGAPVIAVNEKGDATVAWAWDNGGFGEIQTASHAAGLPFEPSTIISNFSFWIGPDSRDCRGPPGRYNGRPGPSVPAWVRIRPLWSRWQHASRAPPSARQAGSPFLRSIRRS